MEEENYETYEEVDTEEPLTVGDVLTICGAALLLCLVVAVIAAIIRRTFIRINLHVGNKIGIELETKGDKNE